MLKNKHRLESKATQTKDDVELDMTHLPKTLSVSARTDAGICRGQETRYSVHAPCFAMFAIAMILMLREIYSG